MEAHPRTLNRVFHVDLRLVVPLFQRPYVWRAETQWLPLWEDVLQTRDRVAHGDQVPHFLGAVVLEAKSSAHGALEVREVIDGQQRLTTLQLLLAALSDAFTARGLGSNTMARRVKRALRNDPDLVVRPDEAFRLWPTNADREDYRAVLTGEHRRTAHGTRSAGVVGAYTWFRDEIDQLVAPLEQDPEQLADSLERLSEVVLEHLEVVVIDLNKEDNAQVIFETLNARGTPLRASDLIKNLLFRTLQDAGRDVETLYDRYWMPLEQPAWQADVRQGRLVRPRLDAFMGYFLTVRLQREVQAHQLFPALRAHIGGDPLVAEQLLRELARYAEVYDRLEQLRADDQEERASLHRMQITDTTTLLPLLLWLFANEQGRARRDAVRSLESYVVRRTLSRLTMKNYNRLFLELLRRLGTGAGPADQVVTEYLSGQGSDSGTWPNDAELGRSLVGLPLYRLLKRDRLQRALLALEAHAQTSKTETVLMTRSLSVEHLLPQAWEEHWPLPQGADVADEERERREALVHTIGNLTLVTQPLNSALSNAGWSAKRAHLLEHSALTLNRSLPLAWDSASIAARSQYLAGLAVSLWPRPAVGNTGDVQDESERDLRPDREGRQAAVPPARPGPTDGSRRRDIAKHVEEVFASLPAGTFLTCSEIAKRPSREYAGTQPSTGAISARLFPSSGRTTLVGVRPDTVGGVRGARKT